MGTGGGDCSDSTKCFVYENFTIPTRYSSVNLTVRKSGDCFSFPVCYVHFNFGCWDYINNNWFNWSYNTTTDPATQNITVIIPSNGTVDCLSSSPLQIRNSIWSGLEGTYEYHYESKVSWINASEVNITLKGTEGQNNITIYGNNSDGNWGTDIIWFTIDTLLPNITIDTPSNATFSNGDVHINGTVEDTNPSSCYTNSTYFTGTINISDSEFNFTNTSDIPEGIHTILILCNDTANNTNSSEVQVQLDFTSPTIVDITKDACVEIGDTITFRWTQADENDVTVSYCNFTNPNSTLTKVNSIIGNGTVSCSLIMNEIGSWNILIRLEDEAGNFLNWTSSFTVGGIGSCAGGGPGGGPGGGTVLPQCEEYRIYPTEGFQGFANMGEPIADFVLRINNGNYSQIFFGKFSDELIEHCTIAEKPEDRIPANGLGIFVLRCIAPNGTVDGYFEIWTDTGCQDSRSIFISNQMDIFIALSNFIFRIVSGKATLGDLFNLVNIFGFQIPLWLIIFLITLIIIIGVWWFVV